MKAKSIAILLTVHNRRDKTLKCLECLYRQLPLEGFTADIYLTDDGCTDGTSETVQEAFPNVHILSGDGNLYWNQGMRLAWDAAAKEKEYDYFLWLNDDTYIYPHTLRKALEASTETSGHALLVGATESETTHQCTYGLKNPHTGHRIIPNGTLQEGTDLNGNFVLVSKEIYQKLGNLDSHYHHARGDTDYGLRAKKKNIQILLLKEYVGSCERHPTLPKWCNPDFPFRQRWHALNHPTGMPLRELFYLEQKHYGWTRAVFHQLTTTLHCCFPKLWRKFKL